MKYLPPQISWVESPWHCRELAHLLTDGLSCCLVQVFVFGPDNLIWELDKASATAENVFGSSQAADIKLIDGMPGVQSGSTLVNGKAVPMHYTFKNGDVLDLDLAMV